jgi:hypothetical protein
MDNLENEPKNLNQDTNDEGLIIYDASKKNIKPKSKFNDKLWQTGFGDADLTLQDDNFDIARDFEPNLQCDEDSIYINLVSEKIYGLLDNDRIIQRILELDLKLKKDDAIHIFNLINTKMPEVELIEKITYICNYGDFAIKKFFYFLPTEIQLKTLNELKDRKKINSDIDLIKFINK